MVRAVSPGTLLDGVVRAYSAHRCLQEANRGRWCDLIRQYSCDATASIPDKRKRAHARTDLQRELFDKVWPFEEEWPQEEAAWKLKNYPALLQEYVGDLQKLAAARDLSDAALKRISEACRDKKTLKGVFRYVHTGRSLYVRDLEVVLDTALGLGGEHGYHEHATEREASESLLAVEQLLYQPTSYDILREFIREVRPSKQDVIYDLGCGRGRVVLYGALTTPAKCRGVELVGAWVADGIRCATTRGIASASFIEAPVQDVPFDDGTIFYMFNPFSHGTLASVVERLERLASKKRIIVGAWAGANCPLERSSYFKKQNNKGIVRLFSSR